MTLEWLLEINKSGMENKDWGKNKNSKMLVMEINTVYMTELLNITLNLLSVYRRSNVISLNTLKTKDSGGERTSVLHYMRLSSVQLSRSFVSDSLLPHEP